MEERMDLKALTAETATVSFDFRGHAITVDYYPGAFTLAFAEELEALKEAESVGAIAEAMSKIIAAWNVEENGEPLPTTAAGIKRIPSQFLIAVQEAISADTQPTGAEKKGFSEPSNTLPSDSTPPASSSPNGSDSSPSPAGSESPPGTSPASASAG
jgi:hypothetical protein